MIRSYTASDTIAAIATAPGEGAIGIVRLSGERSIEIASALITLANGDSLSSLLPQKCSLGAFHQNGTRVDQVMATVFKAPRSFSGEDMVEISCHGGTAVLRRVLRLLISAGARMAEPGEFSQRAFSNGKMDLAQAEAVADLIRARTDLSSQAALDQLEGGLSRQVSRIRDAVLNMMASLEVAMDHTDDPTVGTALTLQEIDFKIEAELERVENLLESFEFGRLLKEGVKIAIVGKPNVGKSSLLNCLLKSERAIVTPHPGTTRDTIEEGFDLLGIPAVLVDTAGLRNHAHDAVEMIGMERTRAAVLKADAVIAVLDRSSEMTKEDEEVAQLVQGKMGVLALAKNDLDQVLPAEGAKTLFSGFPAVSISALKGVGIDELLQALKGQVSGRGEGDLNAEKAVVISTMRHRDCLERCGASLQRAQRLIREGGMEECVALELREALDALGEIIGEVVPEDILSQVFSKFCIGK